MIARTRGAYVNAALWRRVWWGVRPNALARARRDGVDADVEAAIRNHVQLTRTPLYALVFTIGLTLLNIGALGHEFDLQATWTAFALSMTQVGAFFALRRSNETRAYLGDVRLALQELTARSVMTSALIYPRELRGCTTTPELRARATDILRHLMDSQLFPRGVDAFSVWARDDVKHVWRIVAAIGASSATIETFSQAILTRPTDGAGIIANLALTADQQSSYYQHAAADPPTGWFKPDPHATTGGRVETLAVFLLPDEDSVPIGAFSLTSARSNVLEADKYGLPERVRLIVDQCTLTLVEVARLAHTLWSNEK